MIAVRTSAQVSSVQCSSPRLLLIFAWCVAGLFGTDVTEANVVPGPPILAKKLVGRSPWVTTHLAQPEDFGLPACRALLR